MKPAQNPSASVFVRVVDDDGKRGTEADPGFAANLGSSIWRIVGPVQLCCYTASMNHAGGSNRRYTLQFAAVGVSLCLALAAFSFFQPMLVKRWRMMVMGPIAPLPQIALVLEVFQVSSGPVHMLKR
jgi:hypothetical protein